MSVIAAIAVLGLLIFVHELGHFLAARSQGILVTRFAIGIGPVLWRYQGAQTEYSIRAIPLGGYVAFPDDELDTDIDPNHPGLLKNRPLFDRAIVMVAGVLANLVFAYLILMLQLGTVGIPEFQSQPGVKIPQIVESLSPAAVEAGLQASDVVVAVNNVTLTSGDEAVDTFQQAIVNSHGQSLQLLVERDRDSIELTVTPTVNEEGQAKLGVQLAPNGTVIRHRSHSIGALFREDGAEFQREVNLTLLGFGHLFSHFREAATQVSGPVAIVAMGADIAKSDLGNLFQFAALISINLAVINILPLPALDGGQLLFLVFEGLRGKPLPMQLQQGVMQTGFILIFGLGLVLIVRDTINLNWFQQLMQ